MATKPRRGTGPLGKVFVDLLLRELDDQRITRPVFARMNNVSQTQMNSYLTGDKYLTFDEAADFCASIGLTFSEVVAEAEGYLSS